jgi:hypothetical protein
MPRSKSSRRRRRRRRASTRPRRTSSTHSPECASLERKPIFATERNSDSTRLLRWRFARLGIERNLNRLIFLDKSGFNLSMTRVCSRAPSRDRLRDDLPKNWGDGITSIAGLRLTDIVAPMLIRGSLTGDAFLGSMRDFAIP